MIYIDENNNQINDYDLTLGYLVDHEWIDHPAVAQSGHYEYQDNVQTFIVDVQATPAWREVTTQRFVLYTEAELAHMAKLDYATRLENLEVADNEQIETNNTQAVQIIAQEEKIIEQAEEINTLKTALAETEATNAMLTECVLEMSEVVYA